jgi:crotonobetainyl-CoA:carnitine CoA-transferase CaiB-like acyl-CoA transferase
MGPLAGVRVLDLSRILAGPWATQMLADFGADVLKIERPGEGDDTRRWGPPYLCDANGESTGESAYFLGTNRGKRSLALDYTRAEGQALLRELAAQSEILVENYRVGALARYGLDYESLRAINPGLVYCSITGFGQDGPYAARAGYDAAIQAMGGLMSITGDADGAPQKVGVAVADLMTGLYAVAGVLAALRHAEATGIGQHIDLALFDTQVGWLANQAMNYLVGGSVPARHGSAHPNIVPYQVMPARDGHFMLAVGNDAQFRRLCAIAGRPELADDARFATNAARVAHRDALIAELTALLQRRDRADWLAALAEAAVPAAPVNAIDEVFADPQTIARGLRFDLPHPLSGSVPQVANPLRFSATPIEYRRAPPLLGEHASEVLRERLHLDDDRIRALIAAGVIGAGRAP